MTIGQLIVHRILQENEGREARSRKPGPNAIKVLLLLIMSTSIISSY